MKTRVFRSTLNQELSTIYPAVFEITGVIPGPMLLAEGARSSGEDGRP